MRGVSTVLDAALCLLLVAASALVLASTPHAHETTPNSDVAGSRDLDATSADDIAELLATSTARVNYSVDGQNRTAHGTLAGLLTSAVRADALADGPETDAPEMDAPETSSAFAQAVTDRVGYELGRTDVGVQVTARRPAARDESTIRRLVAGGTPPPDVDVHAAEFVVRRVRFTVRTWSA